MDVDDLEVPSTSQNCRRCIKHAAAAAEACDSDSVTPSSSEANLSESSISLPGCSTSSYTSSNCSKPLPDSSQNSGDSFARNDSINDTGQKPQRAGKQKSPNKQQKRKVAEMLEELTIVCPICGETVHGTENDVNDHVDRCVELKEQVTDSELQEYEWAGQSKIRTTFEEAKLFAGSTLVKLTYELNDDRIVDVDDNDCIIYGKQQYTEKDVSSSSAKASSTTALRCSLSPSTSSGSRSPQPSTSKAELQPSSSTASSSLSSGGSSVIGADLTIISLKERIKQLERSEGTKCSVCLDVLKTPLVSVVCWHVYCELCWLQSLKMKKLCPRCTAITTPIDLRRIYL